MSNPFVIRQAWILLRPDGTRSPVGHSYHRTSADLEAFVTDYLSTASPIDLGGQEEPIGAAELLQVGEGLYGRVCDTAHGIRVR